MKNHIKVTYKSGKKKVYPIDKYRLITALKTVAVVATAIIVVILFCGLAVDERHTPSIVSVISVVTSAVVVIVFGTYLLSNGDPDVKERKEKKK